jgi:hypothetical protein
MVYVDGLRRRFDIRFANGTRSIVIHRPDKGIGWSLMPGCEVFYESPLASDVVESLHDPTTLLDWIQDGTEIIDGHECLRFVGHYTFPAGTAYEVCYVDQISGVRRRMITYDKLGRQALTVDCRSVSLGPPEPSVFELPDGFRVQKL